MSNSLPFMRPSDPETKRLTVEDLRPRDELVTRARQLLFAAIPAEKVISPAPEPVEHKVVPLPPSIVEPVNEQEARIIAAMEQIAAVHKEQGNVYENAA